MRADIDKQGRLLLQPESQTEEAALFAWWERQEVESTSIDRKRICPLHLQDKWARVPLVMRDGVPEPMFPACQDTWVMQCPEGIVQGAGNSEPAVTLEKGHQELAAACESEAKKHELAVRAGVEWLVKSLHASIWRELSTFK